MILTDRKNATRSANDRSRASFTFKPFPENIVEVKSLCTSQCSLQTEDATEFIFNDLNTISGLAAPITKRDYIFNELGEANLYICQYTAEDKFGGTWIYFIDYIEFRSSIGWSVCLLLGTSEYSD